jgi:cytochrome c556
LFRSSVVIFTAALVAGMALAHEHATGVIAERMTAMKNMGRELKAIGDMLVGNALFGARSGSRGAAYAFQTQRRGGFVIENASGAMPFSTSFQVTGSAIGNPSRARGE